MTPNRQIPMSEVVKTNNAFCEAAWQMERFMDEGGYDLILAPTLIWLGMQLLAEMKEQESIEAGTATVVDHAGSMVSGIGKGLDGEQGE